MEVCPEAWTGPASRHTDFGGRGYEAVWDGFPGAGACLGPTAHNGLWAEFDGVEAIGRAPGGAMQHTVFDGHYWQNSQGDLSGTFQCYGPISCGGYGARPKMVEPARQIASA